MGSATRTTSTAQTSTQQRAKQEMNSAVENDDLKRAADIGITVLLATQPNGPAKVPMYSNLKHAYAFASATQRDGVGAGMVAAGESVTKTQIAGESAELTVAGAQSIVTSAAERDTISHSIDSANKNLQMPSEQATEDTLAAIMTNGANALSEKKKND